MYIYINFIALRKNKKKCHLWTLVLLNLIYYYDETQKYF